MAGEWDAYPIVGQPQQTQPQAKGEWDAFPIAQPSQPPSMLSDVAKSGGVGLGEGAISTLGTIGDIRSALSSGASYLGGKLGLSPETIQSGKQAFAGAFPGGQAIAAAPTSEQLKGQVENVTGPFYQPQTVPGQYARTLGQFAPAAVAGPGGIVRRAVTQAAIPALASETGGQVFKGSTLEPYARAIGGLTGALAAPAAGAVRQSIIPSIGPERAAALRTLASEGVQVPAGMASGSKILKAAESELGGASAVNQMNEQYTAAALRRAGVTNATRATPDVINSAEDRVGNVFDTVAARNPSIPLGNFAAKAATIANDYKDLTGQESSVISKFIDRIAGTPTNPTLKVGASMAAGKPVMTAGVAAKATIPGESYQAIQSEIQATARSTQNADLRHALYDLKGALDDSIQGGLTNSADAKAWATARNQWKNLLTVQRAVSGSTESAAAGLITPAKLTQAIESMKRGSYAKGKGDFAALARAGNQVMKPFQDSGTASRLMVRGVPAVVGGVLSGGLDLSGIAGATVAPWLAGKALMSSPVQRLLTNQMLAPRAGPSALGTLLPAAGAANQLRRPFQP